MELSMKQTILHSFLLLITLSVLTGLVYPAFITAVAYVCFPSQAKGSLVYNTSKNVIGSSLIGQQFSDNRYFWSRPSAVGYNPMPSGGTNLCLLSNQLKDSIVSRSKAFRNVNNLANDSLVPKEMLFTSASGLDPHISPAAALAQVNRIADARNYTKTQRSTIQALIVKNTREPQFGFLGERRVNVFMLNHDLDLITTQKPEYSGQ
jgi:potassium-transporting ATPase KdpC subunit